MRACVQADRNDVNINIILMHNAHFIEYITVRVGDRYIVSSNRSYFRSLQCVYNIGVV